MGFTLRGLTTGALAANNEKAALATNKDVASVPAAVTHATSVDIPRHDDEYNEKSGIGAPHTIPGSDTDSTSDLEKVDTSAPEGVQVAQAMTQVWSKNELIACYVLMWFIHFVKAFSSNIASNLTPYVTSSFGQHSLTALTWVISGIVSGLWKLPYAKIMDVWGRANALVIGVATMTLGLIMMAACENVETYCAAMTFFYVGYNSIDFSMTVFIADTSRLQNRGFFIAYASSPWLITTWIYPYTVSHIIRPGGIGWRWGYGIFAICMPVVCIPLLFVWYRNERKARESGLVQPKHDAGTLAQKAMYYAREFDIVGILILATGLCLFLLSFNLYTYQKDQWKSPMIICFLVFGFIITCLFGVWEKYFAPVTFIPWPLLKNRTVIFTYTMAASLYMGWYIWNSYFYSLLIVLFNQSIVHAGYISNTYTMGSTFTCLVYGVCLMYYGKLKVYSMVIGVPMTILGVALMIVFRQPNVDIGYVVMCQVFIAVGGGVLVISEQTTLMAVSKQQDFPALLAVESMIISIGGAIGSTIAGAMWTGIFPQKLAENLPESALGNLTAIYGDLTVQAGYLPGTPERDAINQSYGQTQRLMLIAATCMYSITLVSVCLWQNVDVKKQKQRTVGLL